MKIAKNIKDIEFNDTNVYGTWMPVSEPIVMASAAGGMSVQSVKTQIVMV